MGNQNQSKGVYIPSIEASDIMSHMIRGTYLKKDYVGMVPYSLELIKLKELGLKSIQSKRHPNKQISNGVINVKFDQNLKSAIQLTKMYNNKLEKTDNDEYKNKLSDFIRFIKEGTEDNPSAWNKMNSNQLRKQLYTEGFTITNKDGTTDDYLMYKRSSSKSRTGQCLFIHEDLYKGMIEWSRMSLPFEENQQVDLASLRAYESLVGSSIEETITINPDNILVIPDVKSVFTKTANVVRTNKETGFLDSFKESTTISNDIWDGQSLLDADYYTNGKSMKLLRNHFFKSAAFSTYIQKFLQDNKPKHIDYNDWYLGDMFGNKIKATDVHMITTVTAKLE